MNLDLKGRLALVGGGSQGIGLASAIELSRLGATIVLLARDEHKLAEGVKRLDTSKGQNHTCLSVDYNNPEELTQKVSVLLEKMGPATILVNNTGGPPGGSIVKAGVSEFVNTFNQHLICNHLLMQLTVEGMKEENFGRIINVISTSVKQPLKGLGVSNTIRAAVGNWAKTLANELGPFGITVNNVLPGATGTARLKGIIDAKAQRMGIPEGEIKKEMMMEIPAGRFGEPEEIANAVAFLASPAASYINGINLPVDGGRTSSL
jgi:3-oxoacyl-[acyl-carrier protein] reductase